MILRNSAHRLAVVCATALAAATLAPAPANALPVFAGADVDGYAWAHDDSGDCTETETSSPSADNVPVVENGPAVTYTGTGSATIQNDTVPADNATASTTGTVSTKATSVGSNLGTYRMSVSGSGVVDTALALSGCDIHTGVGGYSEFAFTNGQAGWLTIESQGTGKNYVQLELFAQDDGYDETYTYALKHKSKKVIFLPADAYEGNLETDVDVSTSSDLTFSAAASVTMTFTPAGGQTAAPLGKGKKYVALGARSCATNTVAAAVTGKAKRAKTIDAVTFLLNGKKLLKDGNPKKGEAYSLPVATDVDAEITAQVKLKKPKPGKPAKTKEVTSSYIACS